MISRLDFNVDGLDEIRLSYLGGQDVLGIANLRKIGKWSASVYQLFVAEPQRRKGIGHSLMAESCKIAKESGSTYMAVIANGTNNVAVEFYCKLGFVPAFVFDDGRILLSKPL